MFRTRRRTSSSIFLRHREQHRIPGKCFILQSRQLTKQMKPENPEETHADTGRTCKLHTERTRPGNRTQALLAVR
ncbi:hypothetical protein SRHO_G00279430 [Serrasalmus rhombeus]